MNPWEKYQSSDTVTSDGPWSKYGGGGDNTTKPNNDYRTQSLKEMAQGSTNSIEDINNLATQGVLKTATGKGFQDRLIDATSQNIPPATERPFDSNVQKASRPIVRAAQIYKQTVAGMEGQSLDNATSPLVIGSAVEQPIKKGAAAIGKGIGEIKNKIATMAMSPEFKQTMADMKYNHDPRRVLQSIPDTVGHDIPSSQATIKNKLDETGKALEDTINNHPNSGVQTDISSQITKPIDDKISELYSHPNDNKTSINKLKGLKEDLLNHYDPKTDTSTPLDFSKMTPKEILDYRRSKIDPQVTYTGLTKDQGDANEVLQDIRGNLKNTMNKVIPELKPLNQDYGDLKSTDEALQRLAYKAQGQGLPSLKIQDIATLGINKYLANPINRVKFAQWLYTAPKAQVAQASQQIPGFQQAVQQSYGGFKNATLVTPTGLPKPSKIGLNRALPSSVGTSDASVINQPGYVPKGLPEPFQGRSGVDRPYENSGLPSPIKTGQSSGPVINQGTSYKKPIVDSNPSTDFGKQIQGQMKNADNIPLHPASEGKMAKQSLYDNYTPVEKKIMDSTPKTDFGRQIQDQIKAKYEIPLHPAEAGRAGVSEVYPPVTKGNPNIPMHQLEDFNNMRDWESYQQDGGHQSYGPKEDKTHLYPTSGHSQTIQNIGGWKKASNIINKAANGDNMTAGEKMALKRMLSDYQKNIKPGIEGKGQLPLFENGPSEFTD